LDAEPIDRHMIVYHRSRGDDTPEYCYLLPPWTDWMLSL